MNTPWLHPHFKVDEDTKAAETIPTLSQSSNRNHTSPNNSLPLKVNYAVVVGNSAESKNTHTQCKGISLGAHEAGLEERTMGWLDALS